MKKKRSNLNNLMRAFYRRPIKNNHKDNHNFFYYDTYFESLLVMNISKNIYTNEFK